MRRASSIIALIGLVTVGACGGDGGNDNPTGPNNENQTVTGDGNVRATINGAAWRSLKSGDRVTRNGNFYGIATVNLPYALVLGVANVTGPGTFNLNLSAGNGSSAIISNSTGGWGTAFNGGSGTITVTTLTATRIVGTFSFDAVPGSGSATGTVVVRNGTFDLTF